MPDITLTGRVLLTWNLAKCEEGISHYRIYRNNIVVANTLKDIGSIIIDDLPIGVPLSFKVMAVTNKFRTSFESNEETVTLSEDPEDSDRLLNDYSLNFYL